MFKNIMLNSILLILNMYFHLKYLWYLNIIFKILFTIIPRYIDYLLIDYF